MAKRKVRNLLALALLGVLSERPMHPYEMASVLRERAKDTSMKIQWGSLYTVVQNLEKHEFVRATETTRQGGRPERTVYTITEAGRAELVDWLSELVERPQHEHNSFEAALSLVGHLTPDRAIELLRQRLWTLDADVDNITRSLRQMVEEFNFPRVFLIEAEYRLTMIRAEADYVRALLKEITEGSISGIEGWHAYHRDREAPKAEH
ncbi:PadR family transcriptional regulator [Virgisporangium aliadipatigenens]|uniref:PadR family transcriptional regulator n=1 Tax=Virgisporangium aliadipatigenens TaxID=741659 RepID=A0A8J3YI15_9ACTN|nr:PadR family transcriptional regulator [Virgisporangium aliadipatigenens]GIJ44583.1 PadR family transcriptional regulator [Virgisporangium aliadipatigenens]